ncbi:ROK family protein [Patescibacteria group bacterium]|nr:ROK family protein [Patescibacteria group bacterium]
MVNKKTKDLIIGIDIGGTKVKLVLLQRGKIIEDDKYLVKSFKTSRQFLATLIAHIELLIKDYPKYRIKGIGIGLPGVLDEKRQRVIVPPNLQIIKNIDFINILKSKFNLPVRLENDTNCMALAEMIWGAGKNRQSMVLLSLGTGVGGGIVYRKGKKMQLLTGHRGAAGEIGHMIINFNGVEGSRKKGELEQYASIKFLKRRSPKHALTIQKEAEAGKKAAMKVYAELGHYLGFGLANIVNIFDPEIIVLGGGVSEAYKLFIKSAKITMQKNILSPRSGKLPVLKTKLRGEGGAMGAAALWL